MNDNKVRIYQANQFVRMGFFRVWASMGADLIRSSALGWRLFLRDFQSRYRQQIFGVLWVVIGPFIAVLTYALLARANVLNINGIGVPYPIYAYLGFTFWSLVQGIITNESAVMNMSGSFIKQINFSRESLLISPLLTSLVDLSIKVVMFALLCLYYAHYISPFRVVYLFLLIPALLFALGLGMVFAVVGAVVKDVANLLTYFFQFLLLVTPVMYPYPSGSFVATLASYNPFYYLTVVPRDLCLYGRSDMMAAYGVASIVAVLIFLAGWRFYKVSMSRIVEKI